MKQFYSILALLALATAALIAVPSFADGPKAAAQAPAKSAQPEPVVIDLSQQPVKETCYLYLVVGQNVILENGPAGAVDIRAKETDGKGELLKSQPVLAVEPLLAQFKATRAGEGEIICRFRPVQGPSSTLTIKAKVATAIKELNENDNGKTVTVAKGTLLKLTLRGNITTGHAWRVIDSSGTAVQHVGKVNYTSDAVPPGTRPKLGRGGQFVIHYDASTAGKSTLQLGYFPPARNGKPVRTFSVDVVVTP